jgi:hypothetical protein
MSKINVGDQVRVTSKGWPKEGALIAGMHAGQVGVVEGRSKLHKGFWDVRFEDSSMATYAPDELEVPGDGVPQAITILVPFVNELRTFELVGKGVYPYDCVAADQHPDSLIYADDGGGWVPSHCLEKVKGEDYYHIVL